jgi:hypothetical protein
VPDCWCCAQKLHPVLIVICVYAVNGLYVEKEQKSFLVLNRWCCATSVTSSILFNCYLRLKLTVYMMRMKKKIVIRGIFYVEQIINMPSQLGNQRGGDKGGGS